MSIRKLRALTILIIISSEMNGTSLQQLILNGDLKQAISKADELLVNKTADNAYYKEIDSLRQVAKRTYLDFSIAESEIAGKLKEQKVIFSEKELTLWENLGWLEYKIIDGKKYYFNRAVGNLKLRLKQQNDYIKPQNFTQDAFDVFKISAAKKTIELIEKNIALPEHRFRIKYTVSVMPDIVPEGEIIRCWLPWPKENHPTQYNLKLIDTNLQHPVTAPDSHTQRTIYSEKTAMAGKATIFEIDFEITTKARWINPQHINPKPYLLSSELYKLYTAEQAPHIVFTEKIRSVTDKVVGNERNAMQIVEKIYNYICENTIWSGAQEYGIMHQIPHYVLENRKGDCGMQTLLFMSMARYKGIPVRWQSGFMLHPNEVNLHDWCEVYYEGIGWVPLDMSFQWLKSDNVNVRKYYLTGLDAYRLIINDGIGGHLLPAKTYFRSEPFDFQRGELEWRGGNLYFNEWNYTIKVSYL